MGIGGALQELGRFLDECEKRQQVDSVAIADSGSPGATGQVTAHVELTLSTCPTTGLYQELSLGGTSVDDDGRLQLTFETVDAVVPDPSDGVDIEPASATFDADGMVSVTLSASTTVSECAAVGADSRADSDTTADGPDRAVAEPTERSTAQPPDRDEAHAPTDMGVNDPAGGNDAPPDRQAGLATSMRGETAAVDPDAMTDERDAMIDEPDAMIDEPDAMIDEPDAMIDEPDPMAEDDRDPVARDDPNGYRYDSDVPPFRNPELLEDVYESCDTFAEMSEAIDMDVTAETVRRYMIDAGIHEPNSYDVTDPEDADREPTDAETDLQSPVVVTDGIGLPDDVSVDMLVETVRTSSTIYEVKTDIGIGRDEALEMLRQLDLLDHVVGRLATKDERDVSRELVVERLRQNAEPT